jgi:3-hydroxyacyl-CoA dehydrogenase
MKISKVGVVGRGLTDGVIARICAQSGFETVVRKVSQELLDKGMAGIASWLTKDVAKGRLPSEVKDQTEPPKRSLPPTQKEKTL